MIPIEAKESETHPESQRPVVQSEIRLTHASPSRARQCSGLANRIWIDIDNSPHVPFFLPIIDELRKLDFELLLTARDMYQVCELLDFYHLPCKVIGGHYGKNKALKVLSNCTRAVQLIPVAAAFRARLAVSHGSRAQVLVGKTLRIPTLMMHDYEHSIKTGFLEPDWTMMPDVIPNEVMSKHPERALKYHGLKEDVYVPRFRPDSSVLSRLGIDSNHLVITMRPPATEAHYHNPEAEILFDAAIRKIAAEPGARGVILPRNARQSKQLKEKWAALISTGRMVIPDAPLNGLNIIWFSDLVVSGGGTMNREAAALGVPVYSVFRGKIGAVDQYLSRNGRLTLLESVEDVNKRLLLRRWTRPQNSNDSDRPALRNIVGAIQDIMEPK
ncbi:MAG TPA: DUF354 domain-containing protein [Candidatus Acidoferrum sp.]|nr:DUF354 domain-containing protein [Candidatus Acidoferrum sp.]